MSILRKYARPKLDRGTTEKRTLSVRIPADLYEEWQAECERNGYTMSEGIRLLLEHDLRDGDIPSFTPPTKERLEGSQE